MNKQTFHSHLPLAKRGKTEISPGHPSVLCVAECSNKPADILFLLDASSSIWGPNFRKQTKFVRNLVEEFDISPTQTRCGVLTFGNDVKEEFTLNTYLSKTPLLRDGMGRVKQLTGTTRTDLAMQRMRQIFSRDLRADVPKIAVVLTDGQSNHPEVTMEQARLAHQEGVTVFAIGVGRKILKEELLALASREEYAFEVETHDALKTIRSMLVTKTCTVEANTNTLPPKGTPGLLTCHNIPTRSVPHIKRKLFFYIVIFQENLSLPCCRLW